MKKEKIIELFNGLDLEKENLFSDLSKISHDKLNSKPSPSKWSIIQIVHHLYKSEQLSIIYIKRTLSKGENLKRSGLLSKIKGFLLVAALKSNIKFTAPKNVSDVPEFEDLEHYENKWSRIRNDLHNIIELSSEEILESDIFNHPSVGKMNMLYALKFMQAHFDHHKKQIDDIL